jgi:heme exporter protein CcmD
VSYVLAAYGVTLISLVVYGVHLALERRRLLQEQSKSNRG